MSFEKPWGNYLLEKIVETAAPESIAFWPQTMAWKVVFIIILLIGIKKIYRLWQQYKNNAYRREALAWLSQCSLSNENDIRQLPALLRKVALLSNQLNKNDKNKITRDHAIKQHQQITQLSGNNWLSWLDKHCVKSQFNQVSKHSMAYPSSKLLTDLAYAPTLDINNKDFTSALNTLIKQIEYWIKYHQLTIDTSVSSGEVS